MEDCNCTLKGVLLGLLGLTVLLYLINNAARFYIRCTLLYLTVFFNAMLTLITGIPSSIFGQAAYVGFLHMRIVAWWTGIKVERRGYDEVFSKQTGPCVVLCNHQSAVDLMVMAYAFPPRGTVMMKKSLIYIPLFNIAMWLCNCITVDRFNKEKAQEALQRSSDKITNKKLKIWVFPEGTRNGGGGMLPFKKGAFNIAVNAQIPIVPVVASSYTPFFSVKDKRFDSDGEVIIQVMEPIPTQGLTPDDVVALADSTRGKMIEVFDRLTAENNARMEAKRSGVKEKSQ